MFLPIVLTVYFAVRGRGRNYVLLVASLLFYGIASPRLLPLMLGVCLLDFFAGIAVWRTEGKRAKIICGAAIFANIAVLFVFKYLDALLALLGFEVTGIELPVGISFYTFQAMSYVIDVYRKSVRVQKNGALFVTYVSLFPQLVAGPIVRYGDIDGALESRVHSVSLAASGVRLFCVGLAKKMIFANSSGECFERMVMYSKQSGSVLGAWLGLAFFAFQIYFDFSGYSDMARGLGRIFGFEFPENFNYPYISRSITEFWRRWHITLSTWFREYVYIPLGGNRCGKGRMYLNLLCVWGLTGLWHGASLNFLLWGLYFFLLLAVEKAFLLKRLERSPRALGHTYAIVLILLGWLIFACDGGVLTPPEGGEYFLQMLGVGVPLVTRDALFELQRNLPFLLIMVLGCTPLPSRIIGMLAKKREGAALAICNTLALLGFVICNAYLANSGYNPFLYFKF